MKVEGEEVADTKRSMDSEEKQLNEQIQERFKMLPKVVQSAITSADVEKHLRDLANTSKLHLDQWETLENQVMLTLLGFQPIEELERNIKGEVGVDDELAKTLAEGISKIVFEPIRVELERELSTATSSVPAEDTGATAQAPAVVPEATPQPPVAVQTVTPATPPAPAPEGKAVRASISEAYKTGEASTARRNVEDDPYREPIA